MPGWQNSVCVALQWPVSTRVAEQYVCGLEVAGECQGDRTELCVAV